MTRHNYLRDNIGRADATPCSMGHLPVGSRPPDSGDSGPVGLQSGCSLRRPSGLRRTRPRSTRLVVVAPTAHGAAHRTQYPKDQAEDDQDDTDCPKDGVTPKKGRDDQADDADGDQVCLR